MRHAAIEKGERPFEWTKRQREAHAGLKPGLDQQMVVNWDNTPKQMIDTVSLSARLNSFLIDLSVSLLTRRNYVPEVLGICRNFSRRFKNFKVDSQKLLDFFNEYVAKLLDIGVKYPIPEIFEVSYYEPRKVALINLRKDGVKSLKQILEEN
ncbi:MAG: hypothetical protein WC389_19830 [Lutibacter sp.]|jgi:hypothetical protein